MLLLLFYIKISPLFNVYSNPRFIYHHFSDSPAIKVLFHYLFVRDHPKKTLKRVLCMLVIQRQGFIHPFVYDVDHSTKYS